MLRLVLAALGSASPDTRPPTDPSTTVDSRDAGETTETNGRTTRSVGKPGGVTVSYADAGWPRNNDGESDSAGPLPREV